ncbi:hypothetical protein ACFQH6_18415 [Halobacteriaceae archaeon GCM10025711]
MSERPGVDNVLATLDVRRNAVRGFAVGILLALAVIVFFVVIPGETTRPTLFYPLLGFVLAMTTGLLATVVFVAVSAYRVNRQLSP